MRCDPGEVQRLMDVALVRRALAHHRDRHLGDATQLRCKGDPRRVQRLRPDGRRRGEDPVARVAVVGRHLAAARTGVVRLAELVEHDLAGRHPERQHRGHAPVVGQEPVAARDQRGAEAGFGALVALGRDHEVDAAAAVQDPGPLVEGPRERHEAVHLAQAVGREAGPPDGVRRGRAGAGIGHGRMLQARRRIRRVEFRAIGHGCAQDRADSQAHCRAVAHAPPQVPLLSCKRGGRTARNPWHRAAAQAAHRSPVSGV